MDDLFAILYTVVCMGACFNTCSSVKINHIEHRIGLLEGRFDLETKFRREETNLILTKLKEIERKLNHVQGSQIKNGHVDKTVDVDQKVDEQILTSQLNNLKDDVKHLLKAFGDEKSVNSRIRRYIPEIESDLIKYGASTENIENYVINASLEFTLVNECLREILKFANENKLFSSNIETSMSLLTEKVDTSYKMTEHEIDALNIHLNSSLSLLNEMVDKTLATAADIKASSCLELYYKGHRKTGVYDVYPENRPSPISVYCDQDTDGGGWTVFQRRKDGSEDFYRGWYDYKFGFGSLEGEFWLGNEYIRSITATSVHELRIDMADFENNRRYAEYSNFRIGAAAEAYVVTVSGYSGDAGNSFSGTSNHKFSTKDRDHDTAGGRNCAHAYKGGWWYGACHTSNLNGLYHPGNHTSFADGINWYHWLGYHYSLKRVEMKLRSLL